MLAGIRKILGPVGLGDGTGRGSNTGTPAKFVDTVMGRGDRSCIRAVTL